MSLRIAVEGCGHGTLHAIYASVEESCTRLGWPGVDLLIICGDFQSVRNPYDLNCVAMPAKYREMCDFHEYYSGQRKAPYLTIFVGGNHEASNYLYELYYGGWVAENIYYMGAANVLKLGPLTIAGMSGIWKGYNYRKLHYERLPYNEDDIKSIYHVREIDTRKLLQYKGQVDVGISHDWPRGVEWHGDHKDLFRRKTHLQQDAETNQLGNVAAKLVLEHTRPGYWFSGHLHCKFVAKIDRSQPMRSSTGPPQKAVQPVVNPDEIKLDDDEPIDEVQDGTVTKTVNNDEIDLDADMEDVTQTEKNPDEIDLEDETTAIIEQATATTDNSTTTSHLSSHAQDVRSEANDEQYTHFLALDKCLANRDFLQLLELPTTTTFERPLRLSYDRQWLAITRAFAIHEPLLLAVPKFIAPPAQSSEEYAELIAKEATFLETLSDDELLVPLNFEVTAPVYDGGSIHDPKYRQENGGLKEYTNPQTIAYCKMLSIPNPFDVSEEERSERMKKGPAPSSRPSNADRGREDFRGGRGRGGGYRRGRGRGRGR